MLFNSCKIVSTNCCYPSLCAKVVFYSYSKTIVWFNHKKIISHLITISMEEFAPFEKDIVEVMEKIVDISLDAPIGDDVGGGGADSVSTLMDVLGTDGNQDDDMEKEERKKLIQETLASLPRREEEILRMFYGLDTVEDTTLKDIGEDLRLSRERVRQIKNKTLRRLQKSKEHKEKLADFLEL